MGICGLNNEEKKAIEMLRNYDNEDNLHKIHQSINVVLNLIDKQSKEIEELKEKNRQGKMRIVQLENEITARIEDVDQYYTPNDKIKAKIEEVNNEKLNPAFIISSVEYKEAIISVLQSLLEKEQLW